MSTYDGGPAFPVPEAYHADSVELYQSSDTGMTLRDYFAAKALVGIIARKNPDGVFGGDVLCTEPINPGSCPANAEGDVSSYHLFLRWGPVTAYAIADAMLAARNGGAK